MRRIVAEDLDWSLATVPRLSSLCLRSVAAHFRERPVYEGLTPAQQGVIQETLSPSVPLEATASRVGDGAYWKRCCEQRWGPCDASRRGRSWKRMFLERHVEEAIERFIPGVTQPQRLLEMAPLCGSYVKRLDISQLLPPVKQPRQEEEPRGLELPGDRDTDAPPMDHFDFGILLDKLSGLEELQLVYGVKRCGMNFEWNMFEMTHRDCESLAKALKSCKTLKLLRIHQSHIDDTKCRLLVKCLLDHPSLKELDFSHNLIGDRGARAIGKLLNSSKLETLNMYDNDIGDPGAEAIAHALSKNSSLLSLNLCLNRLRDEGGKAIGMALLNNNTLLHLHLGANKVTGPTAVALSKVLAQNNTLKSINLSCNNLGEDGGEALEEAMSYNTSVTECDIRLTQVDERIVSFVNQAVCNNRSLEETKTSSREAEELDVGSSAW